MAEPRKRTTLTLSCGSVEAAQAMGLNMSAIADDAIARAVARAEAWAAEHAPALRGQDEWLAREAHPFAHAIVGPFAQSGNGDEA
jgi:antitoxin CcdA